MNIYSKIRKYIFSRTSLGIIIGGISGFVYYKYFGCINGTCTITSNPYLMILYGTLLGGILLYKGKKKETNPLADQKSQELSDNKNESAHQ